MRPINKLLISRPLVVDYPASVRKRTRPARAESVRFFVPNRDSGRNGNRTRLIESRVGTPLVASRATIFGGTRRLSKSCFGLLSRVSAWVWKLEPTALRVARSNPDATASGYR